jgi:predicted nucleotide-binding protein
VEGVELPSDIDGILYILLDKNSAWKTTLAKELKFEGFDIDMNKAISLLGIIYERPNI